MLAEIKLLDKSLHEQVSQADPVLDRAERFNLVRKDINQLICRAKEAASLFGYGQYSGYEEVSSFAAKWAAYAAYCGSPISVEGMADPERTASAQEIKDNHQRKIVGVVVKAAMQKTVTVAVTRMVEDPIYRKKVKRTKKYLVHDEYGQCHVGDIIVAFSSRPLSKRKNHSFVTKIRAVMSVAEVPPEPQAELVPYAREGNH